MHHFFAHVAGESFRNDDGTDRQAIIAGCRVGEPLLLEADPDNPHDENAVRVLREDGKQIGHLEAGMAAQLANDLSDFSAFVATIRRPKTSRHYGVGLLIVVTKGQSTEVVEAYARDVLAADREVPRRARRRVLGPAAAWPADNVVALAAIGIVVFAVIIALVVRFGMLP